MNFNFLLYLSCEIQRMSRDRYFERTVCKLGSKPNNYCHLFLGNLDLTLQEKDENGQLDCSLHSFYFISNMKSLFVDDINNKLPINKYSSILAYVPRRQLSLISSVDILVTKNQFFR